MDQDKQSENLGPPEENTEAPETQDEAEDQLTESELHEQLEEALREKEQFHRLAQRAQADLDNYKKRASEEQREVRRNASKGVILKVLSVVDDMDRALDMIPEDAVAPGWLEGMQLVHRNLNNLLETEGVSKIDAQGQPFEPWEHEAIFYEPTSDIEEGKVLRVVREGYKLHDQVLRAAQVVVAKAAAQDDQPESTQ